MRRARVLAALLAMVLIPTTPAAAARSATASDFAADCDDDGRVDITGRERYVGGSAVFQGQPDPQNIDRICTVVVSEGATLVLRDVDLTGFSETHDVNLVMVGAPNTRIEVINSSVEVSNFLELTLGCASGEPPEFGGEVVVRRSNLRGSVVLLCTSIGADGGRTEIRDSTITGWRDDRPDLPSVQIESGPNGLTRVTKSEISSGSGVRIFSGLDGRTVARHNVFESGEGTDTVVTSLGRCRSTGNTPAVPCS